MNTGEKIVVNAALSALVQQNRSVERSTLILVPFILRAAKGNIEALSEARKALLELLEDVDAVKSGTASPRFDRPEADMTSTARHPNFD